MARECLSNDAQGPSFLYAERNDCAEAELREKCEQIKKLEVSLRRVRCAAGKGMRAKSRELCCRTRRTPLNDLAGETRLVSEKQRFGEEFACEARAQISTWKRDARVAHLRIEVGARSPNQSEGCRASNSVIAREAVERGFCGRVCVEPRLREALDAVKER
ncbi:hypothetical protein TcBrA4_0012810 [Trypanosoma cruzi]|nr:hypothetical protein TcBrA4_0012810 [Trypanosoma cruzi]